MHSVGTPAERRKRVLDLFDAVRLPAALTDRFPHQLSGGQRQRVALARALALAPRLLIADEPTSALDVSVQAEVLDLFAEIQRELGFACLFISHDLAVVHQVADRVVVLQSGVIVETGPVDTVFTSPREPYTRALIDAVPVPDPRDAGTTLHLLSDAFQHRTTCRGQTPNSSAARSPSRIAAWARRGVTASPTRDTWIPLSDSAVHSSPTGSWWVATTTPSTVSTRVRPVG